jgi:hypothetical protein
VVRRFFSPSRIALVQPHNALRGTENGLHSPFRLLEPLHIAFWRCCDETSRKLEICSKHQAICLLLNLSMTSKHRRSPRWAAQKTSIYPEGEHGAGVKRFNNLGTPGAFDFIAVRRHP